MECARLDLRRLASLGFVAALALPTHGQARRLNAPLPRPGAADVEQDFALSADGTRVVFRCDVLRDGAFALFSAPADASQPPVRLSATLVQGGNVRSFALGGGRAVYLADQDEDETFELYSIPQAGGVAPRRLSGPLTAEGDVLSFHLTPDGQSAVFLADKLVDARPEFFRVPLDGSAPPLALDPSPRLDEVTKSWMAPDGARVLYVGRELTPIFPPFLYFYVDRIFALPLDGSGARVQLAEAHGDLGSALAPYGNAIGQLAFSADGRRIVYTDYVDDKDGAVEVMLNSTAIDGSEAPVVLNQSQANYSVPFAVSASLPRVVYLELSNAYSVALDGTGRVQLDPPGLVAESPLALTPDGTRALFQARQGAQYGLVLARVDGTAPALLLDGPRAGSVAEIVATNARACYVFLESTSFQGFRGVRMAPLDGSAASLLLNGPLVERTGGGGLQVTPGGELLFRNSTSVDSDDELYVVPQDGSAAPLRISAPMSGGRDVGRYLQTPDGAGVVYHADQTFDGNFELFRTSLTGPAKPRTFLALPSGPVVGDVLSFLPAPDGRSLVFMADQDTDQEFRVYRVFPDGREPPTRVGRFSFFGGNYTFTYTPLGDRIVEFREQESAYLYSVGTAPGSNETTVGYADLSGPLVFTPDGTRVLYRSDLLFGGSELVSGSFDDASPVSIFRANNRSVLDYQVTPDERVVYLADANTGGRFELFARPAAGGSSAMQMSPSLGADRDVQTFRLTPDGAQAVYTADARTNELFELWIVALDGRQRSRRLSGPLAASGDVEDYLFSPDGQSVVYRADAERNGHFDLFRVPLMPSTPGFARATGDSEPGPIPLTTVGPERTVQPDYRIALDGQQVFFRADLRQIGVPELYRVPLLGGAAPELLSHPDGGRVLSFELSSDKTRVVYLVDKHFDGYAELHTVSVLGGPVVALDPMPSGSTVSAYHITPDARHVVYLSDRRVRFVQELFRVSLDASTPVERLNATLPAGGEILEFAALPDGTVVYRADQETDEVFELFAAPRAPRLR